MKKEFLVERDGKSFVLYAGLLDEAHQQGLKAIATTLLQIPCDDNGAVAICQATVTTDKGTFTGIGDASPANVTRIMTQHIIRMAETRAKARALRDAINVGVAALEELGDDLAAENHDTGSAPARQTPQQRAGAALTARQNASTQARATGQGGDGASPAQVNAIFAIGRRELHWDEDAVDAHCRSVYGKAADELTKREASELIDRMKTNPAGLR